MYMSSAQIALAVSGHLGANMVDRGHVGGLLCRGQIDTCSENLRMSQRTVKFQLFKCS